MRLPTVFFTERGGGRPGDTDYPVVSALDTRAFALRARLSGVVPRIAVASGMSGCARGCRSGGGAPTERELPQRR